MGLRMKSLSQHTELLLEYLNPAGWCSGSGMGGPPKVNWSTPGSWTPLEVSHGFKPACAMLTRYTQWTSVHTTPSVFSGIPHWQQEEEILMYHSSTKYQPLFFFSTAILHKGNTTESLQIPFTKGPFRPEWFNDYIQFKHNVTHRTTNKYANCTTFKMYFPFTIILNTHAWLATQELTAIPAGAGSALTLICPETCVSPERGAGGMVPCWTYRGRQEHVCSQLSLCGCPRLSLPCHHSASPPRSGGACWRLWWVLWFPCQLYPRKTESAAEGCTREETLTAPAFHYVSVMCCSCWWLGWELPHWPQPPLNSSQATAALLSALHIGP